MGGSSLSRSLSLSLSFTHTHTYTHTHYLSGWVNAGGGEAEPAVIIGGFRPLSHTHAHTHTLTLTHSHTLFLTRTLSQVGRTLVVVNLNQQSDTADLIGGFKPVEVRQLAQVFSPHFPKTGVQPGKEVPEERVENLCFRILLFLDCCGSLAQR